MSTGAIQEKPKHIRALPHAADAASPLRLPERPGNLVETKNNTRTLYVQGSAVERESRPSPAELLNPVERRSSVNSEVSNVDFGSWIGNLVKPVGNFLKSAARPIGDFLKGAVVGAIGGYTTSAIYGVIAGLGFVPAAAIALAGGMLVTLLVLGSVDAGKAYLNGTPLLSSFKSTIFKDWFSILTSAIPAVATAKGIGFVTGGLFGSGGVRTFVGYYGEKLAEWGVTQYKRTVPALTQPVVSILRLGPALVPKLHTLAMKGSGIWSRPSQIYRGLASGSSKLTYPFRVVFGYIAAPFLRTTDISKALTSIPTSAGMIDDLARIGDLKALSRLSGPELAEKLSDTTKVIPWRGNYQPADGYELARAFLRNFLNGLELKKGEKLFTPEVLETIVSQVGSLKALSELGASNLANRSGKVKIDVDTATYLIQLAKSKMTG